MGRNTSGGDPADPAAAAAAYSAAYPGAADDDVGVGQRAVLHIPHTPKQPPPPRPHTHPSTPAIITPRTPPGPPPPSPADATVADADDLLRRISEMQKKLKSETEAATEV